ncbi:hypothetical protein CDD82_1594 [Ophiocordyceps australis]|uniref:Uncharacterized protein n=1 Tax=Ophiocordyceps australis TaxID=1399860 RepID=A0A2C5YEL1_9HYPO|nr:hypothetical protein CDD82_1594 [Ophiocordyceps australis]
MRTIHQVPAAEPREVIIAMIDQLHTLKEMVEWTHMSLLEQGFTSTLRDILHVLLCLIRALYAVLVDLHPGRDWRSRRIAPHNIFHPQRGYHMPALSMVRREISILNDGIDRNCRRSNHSIEPENTIIEIVNRLIDKLERGNYENLSLENLFELVVMLCRSPLSLHRD